MLLKLASTIGPRMAPVIHHSTRCAPLALAGTLALGEVMEASDCGLRIADCGLRNAEYGLGMFRSQRMRLAVYSAFHIPQSAIQRSAIRNSNVVRRPAGHRGAVEEDAFVVEGGAAADALDEHHLELGAGLVGDEQGILAGEGIAGAGVGVADVHAGI